MTSKPFALLCIVSASLSVVHSFEMHCPLDFPCDCAEGLDDLSASCPTENSFGRSLKVFNAFRNVFTYVECIKTDVENEYSWLKGEQFCADTKWNAFSGCASSKEKILGDNLPQVLYEGNGSFSRQRLSTGRGGRRSSSYFFRGWVNLIKSDLSDKDFDEVLSDLIQSALPLTSFSLTNNARVLLNKSVFINATCVQFLELQNNSLTKLPDGLFSPMKHLQMIDLSENNIQQLPRDIFANLKELTTLVLSGNNFNTLPVDLFSGTRALETIRLDLNNQKLDLPSGFLSNIHQLRTVSMTASRIAQLPPNLFWGSNKLTSLHLDSNDLTELPAELFRGMTWLTTLDVSGNKLETLPEEVFSGLISLETLALSFNSLNYINAKTTFDKLDRLQLLSLDHNRLKTIAVYEFFFNRGLEMVDLSHNELTSSAGTEDEVLLRETANPFDLVEVDVGTMHVSSLKAPKPTLTLARLHLDLSYNKITRFDEDIHTFAKELKATTVVLRDNPISCDCDAYGLLQYNEGRLSPQFYNLVELDLKDLKCASPKERADILLSELSSNTLTCKLTSQELNGDVCPDLCKCLRRPSDRALIVNCENADLEVAPLSLPRPRKDLVDHTEVNFSRNRLTHLPNISLPGYDLVTKIVASNNIIETLGRSNLMEHLELLALDYNALTSLDPPTLQLLGDLRSLKLINLFGNPWQCDCDNVGMLNFLEEHIKKVDLSQGNLTCADGAILTHLSPRDLCLVPSHTPLIVATSVTVAAMAVAVALYYRYQREIKIWLFAHKLCLWFVTEDELDRDKKYDAFVSFSHQDHEFVSTELVAGLEASPHPFKLCLHYRDWVPGDLIPVQIARAVDESRRTLIVLSPDFVESVWGRVEFRVAHQQALSLGRTRVIVVLYKDVGPVEQLDAELGAYLAMNTYVQWGDPWFWDKLRYALPHPAMARARDEPGDLASASATASVSASVPAPASANSASISASVLATASVSASAQSAQMASGQSVLEHSDSAAVAAVAALASPQNDAEVDAIELVERGAGEVVDVAVPRS